MVRIALTTVLACEFPPAEVTMASWPNPILDHEY